MNAEINRTINLIKKTHNQPILFHILHCHLSHLLVKETPSFINDDWSKILIYSASKQKLSNYNFESKILKFLKNVRNSHSNSDKFKLQIILYYMINLNVKNLNLFILFEFIHYFSGISVHIDYLISTLLLKYTTAEIYKNNMNKKMNEAGILSFLKSFSEKKSSTLVKTKILPSFVLYDIEPVKFSDLNDFNNIEALKVLESICFYAKYTQNTRHFKSIIPQSPLFLEIFNSYINKEFSIQKENQTESFNIKSCVMVENEILFHIKEAYNIAEDKEKFLEEIRTYLNNLK